MPDEPPQDAINFQQPGGPQVLIATSTRRMQMLSISESELQQLQSISATSTIFFTLFGGLLTRTLTFLSEYNSIAPTDPKSSIAYSNALWWGFIAFVVASIGIYFQISKHNTVQLIRKESGYPADETRGFLAHCIQKVDFWSAKPAKKKSL